MPGHSIAASVNYSLPTADVIISNWSTMVVFAFLYLLILQLVFFVSNFTTETPYVVFIALFESGSATNLVSILVSGFIFLGYISLGAGFGCAVVLRRVLTAVIAGGFLTAMIYTEVLTAGSPDLMWHYTYAMPLIGLVTLFSLLVEI